MKSTLSKLLIAAVVPVAGLFAHVPSAEAQVVVYPSDAYVAAYRPVYYNGYAHYWYNNHWYYRDHGYWHGYAVEPRGLYGYRGEWGRHRYGWR